METCIRGRRSLRWRGGVAAILWSLSLWSGGDRATVRAAAGPEWTTPSGDVQGTRYSSLTQFTPGNAFKLVEEFSVRTETKETQEGQPLVVGQIMYIATPFPNKLIALDLRFPGVVLWIFNPEPNEYAQGVACCDVVNRGAAYANGKIISNLLDDSVVAVDAKTGVQVWRTRLGSPRTGETLTGAPIIVNNKAIVGNAGGELGIHGWVQALDVNMGKSI